MGKIEFQKLDKELPFFKDSMPNDYVLPEPSERQKDWADRTCEWLFLDGPMPYEAKQFISFMKIRRELMR